MRKLATILVVGVLLTSCGSLSTLPRSEQAIRTSLVKGDTKCAYIPYVYSGVAYDFCMLNAEYTGGATYPNDPNAPNAPNAPNGTHGYDDTAVFVALDTVLSGVIDTFALPYTLPMQIKYGSISLQ